MHLEIEHLTFEYYKNQKLLNDLCFSTNERVVGIIGKNGTGKSTLLKLISGELQANSGNITVEGSTYRVIYDLNFYKKFSIEELVSLMGELNTFCLDRLEEYLEGLSLKKYQQYALADLSQGMYKKTALLFGFLSVSDVLLLDEPFESIDAQSQEFVGAWIKQSNRQIILVDHNVELIRQLCTTVLDLDTW